MADLSPLVALDAPVRETPLGVTWAARAADGAPALAVVLAPAAAAALADAGAFVAAVERAGRVAHPGLARLLGAGVAADGRVWAAWEDAPGDALDARLASAPIPAAEVGLLGARAADALAAAHAAGVAHGALAPAWVRGAGGADLLRLAGLGLDAGLRAAGVDADRAHPAGDPRYAAPERLGAAAPDARSDVYSLGAALYEALTGRPPFGGRTTATLMASVLADEPTGTDDRGARQTPGHVTDAVLRAIERDPADRWPSAAELARALRGEPAPPPPHAVPPASSGAGCLGALALAGAALEAARRLL